VLVEHDLGQGLDALSEQQCERGEHSAAEPRLLRPGARHHPAREAEREHREQPVMVPAETEAVVGWSREVPVQMHGGSERKDQRDESDAAHSNTSPGHWSISRPNAYRELV
jgi:hypothetical protein